MEGLAQMIPRSRQGQNEETNYGHRGVGKGFTASTRWYKKEGNGSRRKERRWVARPLVTVLHRDMLVIGRKTVPRTSKKENR